MIICVKWPRTKEEARHYLAGLIVGDGSIESYRVDIYDKNDMFLQLAVLAVLRTYFNSDITRIAIESRKYTNNYRLRIYGKGFVEQIKPLCQNPDINVNFVGVSSMPRAVYGINKDKELLIRIQELLAQNKINSKLHKDRTTYKLRITTMRRFMKVVGVRHPRHILKLYLRAHAYHKC